MDKHEKTVHKGIKEFKCKVCDFTCSQKGHLKQHVALVHEGVKPYKCLHCAKFCTTKGNLRQHISRVHCSERLFVSQVCKAGFKESRVLKQHKIVCDKEQIENVIVGPNSIPSANLSNEHSAITRIGEKSMEYKMKSKEKVGVSEAQAKNIAKSISGGKKEVCGKKMAVSEGPTSKENCNPINEVESVVKLEKSSKKGFFAPFKPPQKLDRVEDEE